MRVHSNGISLNVVCHGPANGRCITLLGGITNDHRLWNTHVARLAASYRVIRIDGRGHGLSDSTPSPYALPQLADDVLGVWDALGVEKSVLAGLGLGGVVAAEVATRAPTRLMALVPISCRASMTPEYAAIWPPMLGRAQKGGVAAIAQTTLERWFSPAFLEDHREQIDVIRAAILDTTLDGYVGSIAALLTLDWSRGLNSFAFPVMYVSGEHDRVGAPPGIMQAMCDATPGATHVILPGATHISPVCNPSAFCDAMEALVSRL